MGGDQRVIAIVPAAGSGERMRLPQSKLLCPIAGKPILARTLSTISQSGLFESILVPCRDSDIASFSKCSAGLLTPVNFLRGGSTRQESVFLALDSIRNSKLELNNLLVLIHDAARCFVSANLLDRSIKAAQEHGAVSAAIPCIDTIYQVDQKGFIATPLLDRSKLKSIQTPQVFKFELLWNAHQASSHQCSDDAGLVALSHSVTFIDGEISNYKVTTIEDLERAQSYVCRELS